jgi:hypothetical protein
MPSTAFGLSEPDRAAAADCQRARRHAGSIAARRTPRRRRRTRASAGPGKWRARRASAPRERALSRQSVLLRPLAYHCCATATLVNKLVVTLRPRAPRFVALQYKGGTGRRSLRPQWEVPTGAPESVNGGWLWACAWIQKDFATSAARERLSHVAPLQDSAAALQPGMRYACVPALP